MIKIYDRESFPDLFGDKQIRVIQVNEVKVCIASFNGQYFAFEYLCPHQKEALKNAKLTAFGEVVCPLHEYRFSLTLGNESKNRCRALNLYKLHIKGDSVYLEF